MKRIHLIVCCGVVAAGLCSCGNQEEENAQNIARNDFVAERNLVDTIVLRHTDFSREVISNGHLRAVRRAELRFGTQGIVESVSAGNGTAVPAGGTIARLDRKLLAMQLEEAKQALEKAELDFIDKLIGYGYGKDTTNVPPDLLHVAKIRSGYESARFNYQKAQDNYDRATLVAPFAGVVANLSVRPYEQAPAEAACTVIDNRTFDVEFNLLESELPFIRRNQSIRIMPFNDGASVYSGQVREINPMVDEKGQVKITARLNNSGNTLLDGMNVKINVESKSEKQLAVPKSAVVIRDGFDVLFTLDTATMKAEWVYVDVVQSNSTHHVVRGNAKKNAELNAGQIVIVSGNLNLADRSQVEIKKQ